MGQTSQNSSRPPSSDPPDAPARRQRPASGRKRGAQPGHARHERKLLPANEVDAVIEHHALVCPECQAALEVDLPDVGEAERQQVWDIPEVKPHVTGHRYQRVTCPHCGAEVAAERPADVPAGAFGARVVALVGLLHGRYRLSMREIVALLLDIYHLPLSPGAVSDLCQVLSQALAAPTARARQPLRRLITLTLTRRAGNRPVGGAGCGCWSVLPARSSWWRQNAVPRH